MSSSYRPEEGAGGLFERNGKTFACSAHSRALEAGEKKVLHRTGHRP